MSCLTSALSRGRLAHAYLFSGPEGSGKRALATALAGAVLCASPVAGDACGVCDACRLVAGGRHPDLEFFQPEAGKAAYPVRQVREEIRQHAYLRPALGSRRFLVIERAEALVKAGGGQREGADTLLKLLEEPAPGTVLILLTTRPEQLPETIHSRCQLIRFDPPPPGKLARLLEAEEKLEAATALFAAKLAGGDLAVARGFCRGRKKDKLEIERLRAVLLDAAEAAGTMPYAELFAVAADLEARAKGWSVLAGALGLLADVYRDAALLASGMVRSSDVLAFSSGPEAEVAERLASRHGPQVLRRLSLRTLGARDDMRRYPARLLLLEVLLLDLREVLEAGGKEVFA